MSLILTFSYLLISKIKIEAFADVESFATMCFTLTFKYPLSV